MSFSVRQGLQAGQQNPVEGQGDMLWSKLPGWKNVHRAYGTPSWDQRSRSRARIQISALLFWYMFQPNDMSDDPLIMKPL